MPRTTGTIRVGDLALRLLIDMGANVTQATNAKILFERPDGSQGSWDVDRVIDGSNLLYTSHGVFSDFDQSGVWTLQPEFFLGSWFGRGSVVKIRVEPSISQPCADADVDPPEVDTVTPGDGVGGVSTSVTPVIKFTKAMMINTLVDRNGKTPIAIWNYTDNDEPPRECLAEVSTDDALHDTITITPVAILESLKLYKIIIPESVRGLNGENFGGFESEFTTA